MVKVASIEAPVNPNYCATVVRVRKLVDLPNADRLKGIPMFGLQAIVGLGTQEGDLGLLFPSEVQLGERYCAENNLFRHFEKNADGETVGYIEDNRRVRAIKLRGNRSDCLFMPLSSLAFAGNEWVRLQEGDQFDHFGAYEICKKYVRRVREPRVQQQGKKKEPRVDERVFPQHFDSLHWLRVDRTFPPETPVVVTQKLHGTSIRIGNVPVTRKLSLREKIARKLLGARIVEHEYTMVYGSRKVVKDANNPDQQHFYDSDVWTQEGQKLDGLIPEGYVVYGEIIGWTDSGAPIQEHYTYDCPPGTRKMYVYRVSHVTPRGVVADLSWHGLLEFCDSTGLNPVPFLWQGTVGEFRPEKWIDTTFKRDSGAGMQYAVPLAPDSPCDEGVCIRIEGIIPEIYKLKSPIFLQHETKMLDKDVIDIDADQNAVEEEDLLP